MNHTMRAMLHAQCEECYAICHIFGIKFKVICEPNGERLRHWIHQLWTVSPEGNVMRQVTIEDTDPEAWRAAIKLLLSERPQPVWRSETIVYAKDKDDWLF